MPSTTSSRIWTHNGILRFTDEKMSKSLGNVVTMDEALDQRGRETLLLMFLGAHWRKPMDFSEETLQQAAARAEGFREVFRNHSEPAPEGEWDRFMAALDDDFNTPEALAIMHGWRNHDLVRRGLELFGLGALAESQEAPTEVVDLARRRQQARGQRLRRGGSPPGEIESEAGSSGTSTTASARPEMTTEQVYGRNAVRELLRGARREGLWVTERALTAEPGSRSRTASVSRSAPSASSRRRSGAATTRAFSPAASPTATRMRTSWPRPPAAPRLPGPGHRPAQPRRGDPERRGRRCDGCRLGARRCAVTPAVCRASAGAVEHLAVAVVPNLARYLNDVKGPALGSGARRRTATSGSGRPTSAEEEPRSFSEPRGKACARSCRPGEIVAIHAGRVSSLNVSVAAAARLRGEEAARCLSRRCYLFDGYNLRAAGLEERHELIDSLASFVAVHGARGVVVFDGVGRDEQFGPLEVRFAAHADAVLERLAAEHRDRERVCLISSDAAVRGLRARRWQDQLARVRLHARIRPAQRGQRKPRARPPGPATRDRLERLRRADGSSGPVVSGPAQGSGWIRTTAMPL